MDDPTFAAPLVIHRGAIGDLIRLTAMLRALTQRWGRPCDVIGGRGPVAQVFANLDTVAEVRVLKSQGYPHLLSPSQMSVLRWLRRRQPSPVYLVDMRHRRFALRTPMTRAEWLLERAGVSTDQILSTRGCPRGSLENTVDFLLRMAHQDPPAFAGRAAGPFPTPLPKPEIRLTSGERRDCRRLLERQGWQGEPLVLLQATARRRNRGLWPVAKWVELSRGILRLEPAAWIVLIGGPQERKSTRSLRRAIDDPRVKEIAPHLSLRTLFALLEKAHSLISLDTGPAHAAAALDCPVTVLAGRADPRRHEPVGSPGSVRVVTALPLERWPDSPADWWRLHDVADIEVSAVTRAWQELTRHSSQRSAAR